MNAEQTEKFNAVAAEIVRVLSDQGVQIVPEGGSDGHITWGLQAENGESTMYATLALSERVVPDESGLPPTP